MQGPLTIRFIVAYYIFAAMHKHYRNMLARQIKLLIAVVLCLAIGQLKARQVKILWLGNSFTYTNNLPAMLHSLALSGGDTIIYDSYTPGGYTLQQPCQDSTGKHKIYAAKWDFVIIQAQSQEPSFPNAQVESQTYPYARVLDSLILDNDSCTQVVFYMTWGKKYGDAGNCASYPVICTFDGITGRLRQSYIEMGDSNHALIAPVGMAWYAIYHADSTLNLWATDNDHPANDGSYLAACVFYGTIFRKTPVGLAYTPLASADTTALLQQMAYQTVFDSLSTWNIGVFDPHAAIIFAGSDTGGVYNFNSNTSANYITAYWYFGPGDSLPGLSATHTYTDTGTFIVRLIVYDYCGHSDTASQAITIHKVLSSAPALRTELARVTPNPAHGLIEVNIPTFNSNMMLQIFSIDGKQVYRVPFEKASGQVDISTLAPGIYQMQIVSGTQVYRNRMVKL